MRIHTSTRYVALAAIAGALACASNKARTDDTTSPDQAAAAKDTTTGRDTLNGQNQNPPGYRGMERDTSVAPGHQQTPTDTFLQRQGQGAPQDTSGYSGIERVDTTGQAGQQNQGQVSNPSDSTSAGMGRDTSGMSGMDSTQMRSDSASSGAAGLDSTGQSRTGDTTGYNASQQPQDSTSAR